ncbi:MAG: glycerophosphodiester phosphodiesterase [Acidimicrobiales bacterium]
MGAGNPWLQRRVLSYAHQGGAWAWPSSTLFAMRNALKMGADALELDVHRTVDGHIVICHDATVDRTTDGTGAICDLTLAQVRALDAAYWFAGGADVTMGLGDHEYPYRGRAGSENEFKIATLAEVLETFPKTILNIDIKTPGAQSTEAVETVARLLEDFGRADDVIVTSFDDAVTASFHERAPHVPTSAGVGGTTLFVQALTTGDAPPSLDAVALQVPERYGSVVVVDRRLVDAAHTSSLAVHVWTVNDVESMGRLVELGVDGIITDLPEELSGVLEAMGARWMP